MEASASSGHTGHILQDEDLTAEQIADIKEAFALFDKSATGSINTSDLTAVMRTLGMNPTENEVMMIMNEIDTDGNGTIELSEFIAICVNKMKEMDTEDEIKKVFRVFDRDGNGLINAAELKYMITHLGQTFTDEEVDELMKHADTNGDGQLNIDEFVKMLISDPK